MLADLLGDGEPSLSASGAVAGGSQVGRAPELGGAGCRVPRSGAAADVPVSAARCSVPLCAWCSGSQLWGSALVACCCAAGRSRTWSSAAANASLGQCSGSLATAAPLAWALRPGNPAPAQSSACSAGGLPHPGLQAPSSVLSVAAACAGARPAGPAVRASRAAAQPGQPTVHSFRRSGTPECACSTRPTGPACRPCTTAACSCPGTSTAGASVPKAHLAVALPCTGPGWGPA